MSSRRESMRIRNRQSIVPIQQAERSKQENFNLQIEKWLINIIENPEISQFIAIQEDNIFEQAIGYLRFNLIDQFDDIVILIRRVLAETIVSSQKDKKIIAENAAQQFETYLRESCFYRFYKGEQQSQYRKLIDIRNMIRFNRFQSFLACTQKTRVRNSYQVQNMVTKCEDLCMPRVGKKT